MNTLLKLGTLAALLTAANAYAHHPAADMVDPDVYAMIEENISDVHLAMEFDEMGSDSADMGEGMASRNDDTGNMAADMAANMGSDLAGDMAADMAADMSGNMGSDLASIGNDLAESASAMSSIEPGSMARQR